MITKKVDNHDDRRVRRTRKLIKQAFLSLLEQKEYEQITVTDIIEKADYNRATFYRHYRDKQELVDEIIDTQIRLLIDAIIQPLKRNQMIHMNSLKPEDITMFDHVMEQIEFYRLWQKLKTIPNFTNKFIDALKYLHYCHIKLISPAENIDKSLYAQFYVYGIAGILFSWIENDFKEPPAYMSEQLYHVLTSPPEQLFIRIDMNEEK